MLHGFEAFSPNDVVIVYVPIWIVSAHGHRFRLRARSVSNMRQCFDPWHPQVSIFVFVEVWCQWAPLVCFMGGCVLSHGG